MGVPFKGKYKEILNSDSGKYGGQGVVNVRVKASIDKECDNREFSLKLKLPAYGVTVFTCTPEKRASQKKTAKASKIMKTADGKSRTATKKTAVKKSKGTSKTVEKTVNSAVEKVKETAVETTSAVRGAVKKVTTRKKSSSTKK